MPTGVGLLLFGLGAGIAMPAATEMIMATLPPARAGVGSAVNDTVREFGGALGVAVIGSVAATSYATSMRGELDRFPDLTATDRSMLTNNVGAAIHTSRHLGAQGDQIASAARTAFVDSMHSSLWIAAGLAALRRSRHLHPTPPPARPTNSARRLPPATPPTSRPSPPTSRTSRPDDAARRRPRSDVGSASSNTDVIVIGGGAAGLTAALVLARARHRVTVVDDQTYRNATVDEFHGFPTRDATAPDRFRADAAAELQRLRRRDRQLGGDRRASHRPEACRVELDRRHHDRCVGDAARHRRAR